MFVWHNTKPSFLHHFFERQVALRPDHPAVECDGQILTYFQLDKEANKIANLLKARGMRPGSLVGIYMTKSCWLYAALLGVLKAGGGYVPIDLKFPVGRVQAILEDADATIVLSEGSSADTIAPLVNAEVINLDREHSADVSRVEPIVAKPTDVCYVIYTSGSTGLPKGVVIEHRNAVNFVQAMHKVYGLDESHRVYQGFSIAFDASVEEIWAAFSHGGTLVVPTEDVSRSTFDAADFIVSRGITCFSTVPSFLALMKPDLPTVKLLIVGGEVCSSELVARWATPDLRMLNTYGPTETTVVATVAECRAGEPITIGTAMPGYETYVLDEYRLPVAPGVCGELYIGGESVARGYMNRPELTADRFVPNPVKTSDLLYRTYDLVRMNADGDLQFVGRADGQVKIRGFRVELSEIETVLSEHSSVRLAAATVVEIGGLAEIAGYVVLAEDVAEIDRESVAELLRSRVPDYMVPKYLDVLDKLPTATSGKVDRKTLPPPLTLLCASKQEIIGPTTSLERAIADVWERILAISPISIDHDFFRDLLGHSLAAAKIVTELREKLGINGVSVRHFYEHRTIKKLALNLEAAGAEVARETIDRPVKEECSSGFIKEPPLPLSRWLCAVLQLASLVAFYGFISAPVVFAIIVVLKVLIGEIEWPVAAYTATMVGFAIWPSWLLFSVALKWTVIGRYKPGRYPVWGFYYFRWWLVTRFQTLSWSQMFVGTPLMSLYFRAMGAKIGKNCLIGTSLSGAFDLINIGDNSSIGTDTHLLGYRIEDGWLIFGDVTIGRECFVGTHCCFGLNVAMGDRARLDDMSLLADGTIMAEGEMRRGSPAMSADVEVPRSTRTTPAWGANVAFGLLHLVLIYAMGYILILSMLPAIALVAYALQVGGPAVGIPVAFAAAPVSILWYLQLVILVKHWAIGKIRPGTYRLYSYAYLRYWFMSYLLHNTRYIVLPLYATVFLPRFLRQLGAKIGRLVEISTIMHAIPDLLEIDEGSFLADACIIGGHRIYNGAIEIGLNKIGKRTFVGNSALVPAGVELGDNGLIGVLSTPPAGVRRTPDGTRWLGSPSFELPGIQQETCFAVGKTFEPSYFLISARALVDLLRVLLPSVIATGSAVLFCTAIVLLYRALPLFQVTLLAPAVALGLSFVSLIAVAFMKWLLMGRFKTTVQPLWSGYVWFNEVVNALYETVAGAALEPLLGTPFASVFLRLMGCKIGRWAFLESTLFSEFDLIQIGDRASLNLGCTIQPHLFENRIMKADKVTIGAGCSVGNMAVVLYSTDMKDGSSLGPLSVLMKGEGLPAGSRWYGIPTQQIALSKKVTVHYEPEAATLAIAYQDASDRYGVQPDMVPECPMQVAAE